MSERAKIEERLRRKEQEIASLDEKLRAAKVYAQALKDILKLLSADDPDEDADKILRAGSSVAQAREVILARSSPVHINELLRAIGREVTRESKASLTSSLAAYVRKGEIFTRPAPNTFGLAELGHDASTSNHPSEPPEEFGAPMVSTSGDDDVIPF